jgi:hypothetical protein
MNELLKEAKRGEIKKSSAIEPFDTLSQVNDIVPTSSNSLDCVEFRSQSTDLSALVVDNQLGDKLRAAHQIADRAPRQITGIVVDINDSSGTIVLRDEHARQVTCIFERSLYEELHVSINARIRVRGNFKRRSRRDLIQVTSAYVLN